MYYSGFCNFFRRFLWSAVFVTSSGDSRDQSTSGISVSTMKKDDISGLERNGSSSEYFVDAIITLDESDIPGASLNRKKPSQ